MRSQIIVGYLCFLQTVSSYNLEVSLNEQPKFCQQHLHLTLTAKATCCNGTLIKPGFTVTKYWKSCSKKVKGKSNTLEDIGWDMYGCVLKRYRPDSDTLSLQDFSTLMTTTYPDDIKANINEEVEKINSSIPVTTLTDFEKLEKIRITYYDIEKAVCTGTVGEETKYGITEKCISWKEENHRSGMCCKKSYPVDLLYKSVLEMDIESATDLTDECKIKNLHDELEPFGTTEIIDRNIQDICNFACKMAKKGQLDFANDITNKYKFWKMFNISDELKRRKFLTVVLEGSKIESDAENYVESHFKFDEVIKAMREYEFADVFELKSNTDRPENFDAFVLVRNKSDHLKYDFMRRKFHEEIIHVPILCSAYNQIGTLMEHAISLNCKDESKKDDDV